MIGITNFKQVTDIRNIYSGSCKKILALVVLLGIFSVTNARKIVVEGVGYDEKSALHNALRHAVEEGVAGFLEDQGLIKNKEKINDKILSQSKGYVKNHFIVSSKKEFSLVRVQVAAEVEMGKLEDDLVAQKLLYEIKNKPRVMIILDERSEDKEMFEKTATHKLEEFLLEKEFKIVEPEQLEKVKELEKAKSMTDADLAVLGFRLGADLVIRGGVSAGKPTPKQIYGKTFFTVPVQLNAHIVRADNAEIIVSKTKRVKKNSQEEFSAAQFGLEIGGQSLAQELYQSLVDYWRSEAYSQGSVELIVSGLNDEGIADLQSALKKEAFIKDVTLRYFETRSALFDVTIKGSVQDLRDLFSKKPEYNLAVTHITANRLGVKAGELKSEKVSFEDAEGPALDIASFSIKEIFPSRVRFYEKNPLATVKLICSGKTAVKDIQVSVIIPDIMDLPGQASHSSINPGEEKEIELKLLLNSEKVLKILETKSINSEVSLTFFQNGKKQTRKLTTPVLVYDRNAMDWTNPYSVASFVTYREPSVNNFARQAVNAVSEKEGMNTAMVNGMAIFQALNKLGVKYVKDPSGSPGNRVLDRVQYPFETLMSGTGDCDDTSVLLAALFSAVGIETAVVAYPDHVLVMFNTEIFEKNRFALGADAGRSISHKGTLWIPLETTLINKDFLTAWTTASQEFNQAISDGQNVSIIELNEAWENYAAISLSNPEKKWTLNDLKEVVAISQKALKDDAAASWQKAIKDIKGKKIKTAKDKNLLGIYLARSGDYKEALKIFKELADKENTSKSLNNHACAYILNGDEKEALKILDEAMKKEKLIGAAINKAISYYLKSQNDNDINGFVSAMHEARELLPEGMSLDKYLGIDLSHQGDTKASGDYEKAVPQKLDRRRLKELIKQRVLEKKTSSANVVKGEGMSKMVPYGGVRGADPEQISQIVDLLFWYD